MLHDVSFDRAWMALGVHEPKRLRAGVYTDCLHNFTNRVRMDGWEAYFHDDAVPPYGVCDSVEQFFARFGAYLESSPRAYAVGFTEVRRADQPDEGGWRWRKWGGYVGERRPMMEYLHDEPEIESIVTFTVLRSKETCP